MQAQSINVPTHYLTNKKKQKWCVVIKETKTSLAITFRAKAVEDNTAWGEGAQNLPE